jgi:hypothetical protein
VRQSELINTSDQNEDSVRRIKKIFFKAFLDIINKILEYFVKLHHQLINKRGNESQICLTSK